MRTELNGSYLLETVLGSSNWQTALQAHEAGVKGILANYTPQSGDKLTTRWRGCGNDIEVTTEWSFVETREQWITRHFDTVEASMADCPPGS